ncbi:MAG: tyrosine-type recombinase/integrase [Desulfuromonadaceae bacterium]|nr:tyrosine-type recombinase/integrase [Desulfuromonadaceae bacterium]
MDSFSDSALSAYFPGLVDICQNEDGQLVYAIRKDDELIFSQEYSTDTESFAMPERKHFQFTIPRSVEVMRHFNQDDEALYDDLLTYLKRFSGLDDVQWANPKSRQPYSSVYRTWNTTRKNAGLPEVRMHDLRHSMASNLVNSGRSILEVSKILGHSQLKTSQRYAHLSNETLLAAVDAAADATGTNWSQPQA